MESMAPGTVGYVLVSIFNVSLLIALVAYIVMATKDIVIDFMQGEEVQEEPQVAQVENNVIHLPFASADQQEKAA